MNRIDFDTWHKSFHFERNKRNSRLIPAFIPPIYTYTKTVHLALSFNLNLTRFFYESRKNNPHFVCTLQMFSQNYLQELTVSQLQHCKMYIILMGISLFPVKIIGFSCYIYKYSPTTDFSSESL